MDIVLIIFTMIFALSAIGAIEFVVLFKTLDDWLRFFLYVAGAVILGKLVMLSWEYLPSWMTVFPLCNCSC